MSNARVVREWLEGKALAAELRALEASRLARETMNAQAFRIARSARREATARRVLEGR